MTALSDTDINDNIEIGKLKIHGMSKDTIRENGLDLTVAEIYSKEIEEGSIIDLHNQPQNRFKKITAKNGKFIIRPGEFMLLSTQEVVEFPNDIIGLCNIRSTFARSGIFISPTTVDAGFCGTLTIPIRNVSKNSILIHVGDRFLHLILFYTKTPSSKPYQGSYQNQNIVREPKNTK